MLAVMKVNAAYVPLDAAFPIERMRFIIGDAEITRHRLDVGFAERLAALEVEKVFLDSEARDRRKGGEPPHRRAAAASIRSATSSTPRARPETRRASPSRTPASAISCASPPSFTAMRRATASIRA